MYTTSAHTKLLFLLSSGSWGHGMDLFMEQMSTECLLFVGIAAGAGDTAVT